MVTKNFEKTRREPANRLLLNSREVPNQKKAITLLLSLIVLASSLLAASSFSASAIVLAQQPPIKFLRTIQVTPDAQFLTGSFPRINYVPATNRFVVTFGTKASTEPNTSLGAGYAYKEYTLDMQATDKTGLLEWYANASEAGDSGSCMVNSTYYHAFVSQRMGDPYGWRLVKYDAASWTRLQERYVNLTEPHEANTDPTVAYINGQLDVSDQYNASGIWQLGYSSVHYFFTADLQPMGRIILNDTAHISGSSIIFVNDVYYLVSASSYPGGLVLMKYDRDWHYMGMKNLTQQQAHWSQGLVYDGDHFYLAYLDTHERNSTGFFPVYPNVHLAVFDRDWNLLHDAAITEFVYGGDKKGGRPWVTIHGNLLYVSYDVDTVNLTTREEEKKWQAYVSIFEISQIPQGIPWPLVILGAGIVVAVVVAATYIFLKRRERRTRHE
jgi:hypothetical protein